MRTLLLACLACLWAAIASAVEQPLETAVRQGDVTAARAAIEQGAPVDVRLPPFLMTPLAIAAVRGDLPMVRLLLAAGADPNAPGNRGMNALSAATRSCRAGLDVIDTLIAAGADLEDRSAAYLTPLMTAIQEQRTGVALRLIAAGADVNIRNPYGDGVLNYAIYAKSNTIVRAALRNGVDTSQMEVLFTTALYDFPGFGRVGPFEPPACDRSG